MSTSVASSALIPAGGSTPIATGLTHNYSSSSFCNYHSQEENDVLWHNSFPFLSKEIIEQVIRLSDEETARSCRLLCKAYLSVGRQVGMRRLALNYGTSAREGWEFDLSLRLKQTLQSDKEWARRIRCLKIMDRPRVTEERLEDFSFYGLSSSQLDAENAKNKKTLEEQISLSEGHIFHDSSLPCIMRLLRQLKTLCISCDRYDLDAQRYYEHTGHQLSSLIPFHSLETLWIRGISNLELDYPLRVSPRLKNCTISYCSLRYGNHTDVFPPSSPANNLFSPTLFFLNNLIQSKAVLLKQFTFHKLTTLQILAISRTDILCCGAILKQCGATLEYLDLSTKFLSNPDSLLLQPSSSNDVNEDADSIRASDFLSMHLSNLIHLKQLSVNLCMPSTTQIDEIAWFLSNVRAMGSNDAYPERIRFVMDTKNHALQAPTIHALLESYQGWSEIEEVFGSDSLIARVRELDILISVPHEYEHPVVGLVETRLSSLCTKNLAVNVDQICDMPKRQRGPLPRPDFDVPEEL
ncbi:hypothetical protein D9613_012061 [Agrocybe pediades]|uniref:Uncharacterized protein n=1 Tax=Agrocybe pediades TaxID=84607 RepID=A0A8H4QEP0_9AGAR|nr:hypothetical protein D9613_012061 [Agrocybe pediades]